MKTFYYNAFQQLRFFNLDLVRRSLGYMIGDMREHLGLFSVYCGDCIGIREALGGKYPNNKLQWVSNYKRSSSSILELIEFI